MLSSHIALLQQGHCITATGTLGCRLACYVILSLHHNSCLCMDPKYPVIDSTQFQICDGREFYCVVKEPIPPNASEAIGKVVDLCMFVDGDHAGDQHTQRFLSGFLIYLNTALISWYSKRQSMIETCTFSA